MGVNSWPKTVTRQRRGCDLNPVCTAPESSTLTSRLPSHHLGCLFAVISVFVIVNYTGASNQICDVAIFLESLGDVDSAFWTNTVVLKVQLGYRCIYLQRKQDPNAGNSRVAISSVEVSTCHRRSRSTEQ